MSQREQVVKIQDTLSTTSNGWSTVRSILGPLLFTLYVMTSFKTKHCKPLGYVSLSGSRPANFTMLSLSRPRLKFAFTLYKAMLSWRHEQIAKTASTTTQGYPPSWTDVTFRIGTDHICKFLRNPFHLST